MELKKGQGFSADALIGASVIIIGLILVGTIYLQKGKTELRTDVIANDFMQSLSELKVKNADGSNQEIIGRLVTSGVLNEEDDIEKFSDFSILKFIGAIWARDTPTDGQKAERVVQEFANDYFGSQFGADFRIGPQSLLSPPPADAKNLVVSKRMIPGVQLGTPTLGSAATVELKEAESTTNSKFAFFGGFIGQGHIEGTIEGIPQSTAENNVNAVMVHVEGSFSRTFSLKIADIVCIPLGDTGFYSKNIFSGSCLNAINEKIASGTPINFELNFDTTDLADGRKWYTNAFTDGGFIQIAYKQSIVPEVTEDKFKVNFLKIKDGFLNVYSSLYIPGTVTELTKILVAVNLQQDLNPDADFLFTIGNYLFKFKDILGDSAFHLTRDTYRVEVDKTNIKLFKGGDDEEHKIGQQHTSSIIPDMNIFKTKLSEQTVPYRIGFSGVISARGISSVSIVTDGSGSMNWILTQNYVNGVNRDNKCDNREELFQSNTRRMSIAKCMDKDLVDSVLRNEKLDDGVIGNLVSLVLFGSDIKSQFSLSEDKIQLRSHIDTYDAVGSTCICCGINKAREQLITGDYKINKVDIIRHGCEDLRGAARSSCRDKRAWKYFTGGNPGVDWFKLSYIEGASWTNTGSDIPLKTFSGAGNFYLRKRLSLSLTRKYVNFNLYYNSNINVYINENLIFSDIAPAAGEYWNKRLVLDKSLFRVGDNTIAVQLINDNPGVNPTFDMDMFEIDRFGLVYLVTDGDPMQGCGSDGPYDATYNAAKNSYYDYGIPVYALGVGRTVSENTLRTTVDVAHGHGKYARADNAEAIERFYQDIASLVRNIIPVTGQTFEFREDIIADLDQGYIEVDYTPTTVTAEAGKIPTTILTSEFGDYNPTNPKSCSVNIPKFKSNIRPLSGMVTSYSADKWTTQLNVNGQPPIFNLDSFPTGELSYTNLGDPFVINFPNGKLVSNQDNTIQLQLQKQKLQAPETECSEHNKLIFNALVDPSMEFSETKEKAIGCRWYVQDRYEEDGDNYRVYYKVMDVMQEDKYKKLFFEGISLPSSFNIATFSLLSMPPNVVTTIPGNPPVSINNPQKICYYGKLWPATGITMAVMPEGIPPANLAAWSDVLRNLANSETTYGVQDDPRLAINNIQATYDPNDALDLAFLKMLEQYDFEPDGTLNIGFGSEDINYKISTQEKIPQLGETIAEVQVWEKS